MAKPLPRLPDMSEEEVKALFAEFALKFEKSYKNEDEAAMRMEIFRRNLKRIDEASCTVYGTLYILNSMYPLPC